MRRLSPTAYNRFGCAHPSESELQNQDGGTAVIMFQNAAVKGSLDPMQRARYDGRTMDTAPGAGRPVEL